MAIGLAGAAVGLGLLGTFTQAEAQKQSAEFNAKMSERDAELAGIQGKEARLRGLEDEAALREEEERLVADQRAAMAAQGIDVESGTALQLQESVSRSIARDIQRTRTNAIREEWGLKATAGDAAGRAAVQRATGRSQSTGTIIGGVSNAAYFGSQTFGSGGGGRGAAGQSTAAGTAGGARVSGNA